MSFAGTRASVFEPAIYFAEEGIRIDPMLGRAIAFRADILSRLPETRAVAVLCWARET